MGSALASMLDHHLNNETRVCQSAVQLLLHERCQHFSGQFIDSLDSHVYTELGHQLQVQQRFERRYERFER